MRKSLFAFPFLASIGSVPVMRSFSTVFVSAVLMTAALSSFSAEGVTVRLFTSSCIDAASVPVLSVRNVLIVRSFALTLQPPHL